MKNQSIAEINEQYFIKAEEARQRLVKSLHSNNLKGAYSFISDALAHAMTSRFYEDEGAREELQNNYFALSHILDMCMHLKEAEAWVTSLTQLGMQAEKGIEAA